MCQLLRAIAVSLGLLVCSLAVDASDRAKEKRWAEQIVDSLLVGDAVWLPLEDNQETKSFLGLYTESAVDKTLGGVIIIHGIGVHPNWTDVIHPLRSHLPELGWASLSIQMPVLKNEATAMDYVPLLPGVPPRIEAAIRYFHDKGIQNISIIAHSLGTVMTAYYLTNSHLSNKKAKIKSYVGISMIENESDDLLSNVLALRKIRVPVLDIYGSNDQKPVTKNAEKRSNAAREAGNTGYQQVRIKEAGHFYRGKEDELVNKVHNWLMNNL